MKKTIMVLIMTLTIGMVGCGSKPEIVEQPEPEVVESVEDVVEPEMDIITTTVNDLNDQYSKKLYGTLTFDGSNFIVRSNNDRAFYNDEAAKKELLTISKNIYDTLSDVYDKDVYYMFTTSDYELVSMTNIDGVYYTMCFEEMINDLNTYIAQ